MKKERWLALMNALQFETSLQCHEKLCEAYSEKHRHYHTTKHIEGMLKHYDAVQDLAERPAELELAIWFHDAIYKPFSKTNEFDSAEWAKIFCLANGCDPDAAERVHKLIMATLHNGDVNDNDQKLIVDIDLTILGAASEVYDEFEQNVRKEYKYVPSIIFRSKRKALLRSFLNNPNIYNLDYFQGKFESAARDNISRAIDKL